MVPSPERVADRYKISAAKIDLHEEWAAIVRKVRDVQYTAFTKLLTKLVGPFEALGYDLDLTRSGLDVRVSGSDGARMEGTLVLKDRPNAPIRSKAKFQEMLYGLIDTSGSVRQTDDGWLVDLGE